MTLELGNTGAVAPVEVDNISAMYNSVLTQVSAALFWPRPRAPQKPYGQALPPLLSQFAIASLEITNRLPNRIWGMVPLRSPAYTA